MKRKKQPRIIDVEPVEVQTVAVRSAPRARQAVPHPLPEEAFPRAAWPVAPSVTVEQLALDEALYRAAVGYALPWAERVMGISGLAGALAPWAEYLIAEAIPAPPKPRRRLR